MGKSKALTLLAIISTFFFASLPALAMYNDSGFSEQKLLKTRAKFESLELDPKMNEDAPENPLGTVSSAGGRQVMENVRQRVWLHFQKNYQGTNDDRFLVCKWAPQQ